MKLFKMIEMYLKYDDMYTNVILNAFICINNHINSCIKCMLSSRDDSSSHATWQNLGASSLIKWTRTNGNDSHPSISSEPLSEEEESNPMATPNFAYKLTCSLMM